MRDLGHRVRFEALFERYGPDVLAYARRRSDAVTADDVTSEVFVIVWRRLDEVPEEALPWLLGCARKVLANQRRADRRLNALRGRLSDEHGSAGGLHGRDDHDGVLGRALSGLSERDRELLLLISWDGLDHGQAAAVLGCSRATISVRLHRARSRLARALEETSREDRTGSMEVSR